MARGDLLTAFTARPGVNLEALSAPAWERLLLLDRVLSARKIKATITSGQRPSSTPSYHPEGGAIDFVIAGDMAALARDLAGQGFRAQYEAKGQKNPSGSVATGNHLHVTLTKGTPVSPEASAFLRSPPRRGGGRAPSPEASVFLRGAGEPAPPRPVPTPGLFTQGLAAISRLGDVARAGSEQYAREIKARPLSALYPTGDAARRIGTESLRAATAPLTTPIRPPRALSVLLSGDDPRSPYYTGGRVLDYALDLLFNPGEALTGKGLAKALSPGARLLGRIGAAGYGRALSTRPGRALTQAAAEAKSAAAPLYAAVDRALARVDLGASRAKIREIRRPLERVEARRVSDFARIGEGIAKRQEELRIAGDDAAAQAFRWVRKAGEPLEERERIRIAQRANPVRKIDQERAARALTPAEDTLLKARDLTGRGAGPLQSAVRAFVEEAIDLTPIPEESIKRALGELSERMGPAIAERARLARLLRRLEDGTPGKAKAAEQLSRAEGIVLRLEREGQAISRAGKLRDNEKLRALRRIEMVRGVDEAKEALDALSTRLADREARAARVHGAARAQIDKTIVSLSGQIPKLREAVARAEELARGAYFFEATPERSILPYLAHKWATHFGVPAEDVLHFGNQVRDHIDETLSFKKEAGGRPFILGHETFDVESLRRAYVREYLSQGFTRDTAKRLHDVGAQAYSGGGIKAVIDAGLSHFERNLVTQGVAKDVAGGVVLPGHKIVERSRAAFSDVLHDRQVPIPVYNWLVREASRAGRGDTKVGEILPGFVEPVAEIGAKALEFVGRGVGVGKSLWLALPPAQIANIFGNHAFAEMAAREIGKRPADLARLLPRALEDVKQARGARFLAVDPDITRLRRHTRAFDETLAARVPERADAPALAGLGGTVRGEGIEPGAQARLARAVSLPADVHQTMEQAYKLALFRLARTKMGDEQAARLVNRYLFEYSDRNLLLLAMDRYGLWVFNHFPVQAQIQVMRLLATRPDIVATAPRVREQLFSEFPGSREAYAQLPEERQRPGTFPVGEREFVDLTRFFPQMGAIETLHDLYRAGREGRAPDVLTARGISQLPGRTILSPELSSPPAFNRRLFTPEEEPWKVVEPGTAPGIGKRIAWGEWITSRVPILRSVLEVGGTISGAAPTGSRYGERLSPGRLALSVALGIKTFEGEDPEKRLARLGPRIAKRQEVAARIVGEVFAEIDSGKRKVAALRLPKIATAGDAIREIEAGVKVLVRIMQDPRVIGEGGKVLDRRALVEQASYLKAVEKRGQELLAAGRK